MTSLSCHHATSLYDDWRDRTLAAPEERELIRHLESCPTCSMEFERRDEALEALGRTLKTAPGPSAALQLQIRTLGSARRTWMPYAAAAACLVAGLWLGSQYFGDADGGLGRPSGVASWLRRRSSVDEIEERLRHLEETRQSVSTMVAAYEAGRILERELGDSNLTVHRGRLGSMVTVLRGDDPDEAALGALVRDRRDLGPAIDPLLREETPSELGEARPGSKLAPELVSAIVRELVKKEKAERGPFAGGVQ